MTLHSYVFKASSIIDLLSFLPMLLQIGLPPAMQSVMPGSLPFLRLLRILRLQRYVQVPHPVEGIEVVEG